MQGGAKKSSTLARKAAKGKRYGCGPATTDEQMMCHLGDILGGNMREDFIVVHFQDPCNICRTHVNGGTIYSYRCVAGAGRSASWLIVDCNARRCDD